MATIAFVGNEAARERIWLQFDAALDDAAVTLASWAVLESLIAERVTRYKQTVVGRAHLALVLPGLAPAFAPVGVVPYLDAGALGAQPALLAELYRFGPSLVVHVQDWSAAARALDGVRVIESFALDPGVHGDLPLHGRGSRWSRSRRAYRTVLEGPDWRVGDRTAAHVRRMGFTTSGALRGAERDRLGPAVHELAPGRFAPALAWRRLGGGNLGELALAATGAHGLTGQMAGGGTVERAGAALALAEGAIVNRLHLETEERAR